MKLAIWIIAALATGAFIFYSSLTTYESLSVGLFIWVTLNLVDDLTRKNVILDVTLFLATLMWLVMPVVFYHYYPKENLLARTWIKYMMVPTDEYFSFVLPGTIALILGIRLRLVRRFSSADWFKGRMAKLREEFKGNTKAGFILIGLGLAASLLERNNQSAFQYVIFLFSNLTFVGVLYLYFSDYKYRKQVLLGVILANLAVAMITSMFGKTLITLALVFIIISMEFRISFLKKFLVMLLGVFLIVLIQSVKPVYREVAWKTGKADSFFYLELIGERLQNPEKIFNTTDLFWVSVRLNQGWLISGTLHFVPDYKPFAYGETIKNSLLAVLIPRFLWPDKPQAGGKYNLKRFWGFDLRGFSMNIGPISEGYANYGRTGGIIFMFFYGLFFNMMMVFLLKKTEQRAKLLCWLPFLFFFSVGVETDMLSTMNALVKNSLFMVLLIWAFRKFLGINLL